MADSFINKLTENIRLDLEDYCIFDIYDNVLNVYNSEKISYYTLANQLSSLFYEKASTDFVNISGDILTGFLTLHQNPISSMHAATKSYVDTLSSDFRTALSGLSSSINKNFIKSAVSSITIASPNNTLTILNPTITSSGTINIDVNSVPLNKLQSGGASDGQFLIFNQSTQTYAPSSVSTNFIQKPATSTNGQILTYNGSTWVAANAPTVLPTGTSGQILTHNGTTWIAANSPSVLPSGINGQVLTYNGTTWVAANVPKELPPTASNGQVLTYNGSAWVAANAPAVSGGGGTIINNVDNTPIGTINYFAASAAPVGYLECNGAIVRKADYADLYSVIKDTYTNVLSGDHFRLPDLRGEFVRGWDNGRNINPGRVFGSNEDGMFESHAHEQTGNSLSNSGASDIYFDTGDGSQSPNINSSGGGVTISNTGGAETRPRNVALLPCIKALKTVTGPTSVANSYIKAFGSVKYQNGDTSGSDHSTGGGSQATEMTAFSFHNVVSVTWMERGIYRITLTNAMPNINYTVVSQIAPANNFTFASNSDENFMDYSSPDYYHNGNEGILLTFNKTTSTFDIVCWSPDGNKKENLNGFDFLVLSV